LNNPNNPLIVLPAPSMRSMDLNSPLMGEEGFPVLDALDKAGYGRKNFNYTYAVACRYPSGDIKGFNAKLKAENKKRAAKNADLINNKKLRQESVDDLAFAEYEDNDLVVDPIVACEGRLKAIMAMFSTIIPMGKIPAAAIMGGSPIIEDVRGGPTYGEFIDPNGRFHKKKVLPTVEPNFLLAKPSYLDVVALDIQKAMRFHLDALRWEEPTIIHNPTPLQVAQYLEKWAKAGELISIDTETTWDDPLVCTLRCIGIGTNDTALVIPFDSVENPCGDRSYLETERSKAYIEILKVYFADPKIRWLGQNFRVFDYMALESTIGFYPVNVVDQILLAHLADNEVPRGLAFWGSIKTDVPAWKSEHTAVTAKTDRELHQYCGTDVVVTRRIVDSTLDDVNRRGQAGIYKHSKKLQDYARGMHKLGAHIDNQRLMWHYYEQEKIRSAAKEAAEAVVGDGFNINSRAQLTEFLYLKVGAPILDWTASGDPSTKSATLRKLRANPLIDDEIKHFITNLLRYRESDKIISTYLRPLSPLGLQRDFDLRTGLGRIHPDYNPTGTPGGRFTSSGPNWQNVPEFLRDVVTAGTPDDDYFYVYYDLDQLELRAVAALSQAKLYMDVLQGRPVFGRMFEPHNLTGYLVFGQDYFNLEGAPTDYTKKGTGKFADTRALVKNIYYLFQYMGGAERALEALVGIEKEDGTPLFADAFTDRGLTKVRAILEKMRKALPEIPRWWKSCHSFWRTNGYIDEPIWGRRKYFKDGFDPNAIVNFPAQAGGFAIAAEGLFRLEELCPFDFKQGTGLMTQTHDSGVYRIRFNGGAEDKKILLNAYEERINANYLGMSFTGEAKLRKRWVPIKNENDWERVPISYDMFAPLMLEKEERNEDGETASERTYLAKKNNKKSGPEEFNIDNWLE
jgi:DNA polymerase I-like protein with 3'-5' exonuclease and polymerase domains